MRTARAAGAALLVAAALTAAGCAADRGGSGGGGSARTVTVFAAASLTETFDALADEFQSAHHDVTVQLSYGGSSTLAQQIDQGAPADVFAAASPATMQTVTAGGRAAGAPVTFARNTLTIVTPPGSDKVDSVSDLGDPGLTVVVCASVVPCGSAADKMFAAAGVTPSIASRDPDVRSVLAKVESGDADAGIVYVTDAEAAGDQVRTVPVPRAVNQSTAYQIVSVAGSSQPALAADWVALVTGETGQQVLKAHGFLPP